MNSVLGILLFYIIDNGKIVKCETLFTDKPKQFFYSESSILTYKFMVLLKDTNPELYTYMIAHDCTVEYIPIESIKHI